MHVWLELVCLCDILYYAGDLVYVCVCVCVCGGGVRQLHVLVEELGTGERKGVLVYILNKEV